MPSVHVTWTTSCGPVANGPLSTRQLDRYVSDRLYRCVIYIPVNAGNLYRHRSWHVPTCLVLFTYVTLLQFQYLVSRPLLAVRAVCDCTTPGGEGANEEFFCAFLIGFVEMYGCLRVN